MVLHYIYKGNILIILYAILLQGSLSSNFDSLPLEPLLQKPCEELAKTTGNI